MRCMMRGHRSPLGLRRSTGASLAIIAGKPAREERNARSSAASGSTSTVAKVVALPPDDAYSGRKARNLHRPGLTARRCDASHAFCQPHGDEPVDYPSGARTATSYYDTTPSTPETVACNCRFRLNQFAHSNCQISRVGRGERLTAISSISNNQQGNQRARAW